MSSLAVIHTNQLSAPYDVLLKLVMVGDSGVGKTSLVRRFVDDAYSNVHLTTIGVGE